MEPLIIANWKMNPNTLDKAKELFDSIEKGVKGLEADVIICPSFGHLSLSGLKKGAQNCHFEQKGAYTGEMSVQMLKDLGCQYVIVGHSERRTHFSETNELINKKIQAVLDAKLIPIFCIGETEQERKDDQVKQVLQEQIESGLKGISFSGIIAYEPVWAIGTGNACDVEEAKRMKELISKIIPSGIPLLYGGSANSKNTEGYIKEAGFAGLLVGGASLKPDEFVKMVQLSI